jgi:hypothetical protein
MEIRDEAASDSVVIHLASYTADATASLHYSRKWSAEEFFVRAKQRCDKLTELGETGS